MACAKPTPRLMNFKERTNDCVTIDDVIEECKLFYFAGQETTTDLLTWSIIVLSMHPNWQDKARAEVLEICGTKTPDLEAINRLKIQNGMGMDKNTLVYAKLDWL
ncbi:cytochrome P450 family protein [Medicago truncatula]|uniref:Cytochrome P450 family protein n=1 Tax=Medicago truncatula TaxID=3880 RepID=G7J613_MEDTR|nr:cytochrome P450 family protein [Medicago truncatula]